MACEEYLAETKWGRAASVGSADTPSDRSARTYQEPYAICSDIDSPSAGTRFPQVKFGLRKAFFICFETSTTTNSLSASYMTVHYKVAENAAMLLTHKVREAMGPSGDHPMDYNVHVEEFVGDGMENGTVGRDYGSKKKSLKAFIRNARYLALTRWPVQGVFN